MKRIASIFFILSFFPIFAFGQPPYSIHDLNRVTPEERAKIDALLPDKPFAEPKKPRRLLIYDVNASYGGHSAIAYADYAFAKMGEKTGAFEAVLSRDKSSFERENLKKFDAIFFNNVVGAPFEEPELFANIEEFVRAGGGLLGVHGTSAAFILWDGRKTDLFPKFGEMIGGRGAHHRAQDEKVWIKVEEPDHPLTAMFPAEGFGRSDEFFRFPTVYSREKLRVLLSIDTEKTDLSDSRFRAERADGDYGIAWIQRYGAGRVFYCSIAHERSPFFDPAFLKFYLAAAQYALGDLDVPDQPKK